MTDISLLSILRCDEIAHACFTSYRDAETESDMPGLAAARYYRFDKPVEVRQLRLYPTVTRWSPEVKGQPKNISVWMYESDAWSVVMQAELPPVPENGVFHAIDLPVLHTSALRLICNEEHPVPPSHGEQWANPKVVPFRILKKVEWLGIDDGSIPAEPVYNGPLVCSEVAPESPPGMTVEDIGTGIRFAGDHFSVTFCKRRPLILELGWDSFGKRYSHESIIPNFSTPCTRMPRPEGIPYVFCGPVYRGLDADVLPRFWGGEFAVVGNRVSYKNLSPFNGLKIDVEFVVHEDGMEIALRQEADRDIPVAEYSCWQFPWDGEKSLTGTLGLPDRSKGRTGVVPLPAYWNSPGRGALLVRHIEGDQAWLQVDSWRAIWMTFSGLVTGVEFDERGFLMIKKGIHSTRIGIRKEPILPSLAEGSCSDDVPEGILRHWATVFTFRPELAGFGNSHLGCNCHLSQAGPCDMAALTRATPGAPDMLDLARYTIEFALRGGPGYGDIRDMYLDSDPVLVYSAVRLHMADKSSEWGRANWQFIKRAASRSYALIDEQGLICCHTLTGNSGSHRWSCNGWDVVSFGHYDGYVNALAYRAFRSLAVMANDLGDSEEADRAGRAAAGIESAYLDCFFNPDTGFIAGWRSQDGELHDHGFVFITCLAIVVGLVDDARARAILSAIEDKRKAMGMDHFRYGMPPSLQPLPSRDLPVPKTGRIRADGWDDFGNYVNGSLTSVFTEYYLSALHRYGFTDTADAFVRELNETLASNKITKSEFFTWEGYICGYEGVLVGCYRVLLSMLEHLGLVGDLP